MSRKIVRELSRKMKVRKRLPKEKNRRRIRKITEERLKWIKNNHNRFHTENELLEAMIKDQGHLFRKWDKEKGRILLKIYYGERINTSNKINPSNRNIIKCGGNENSCYLCNVKGKSEKHHISYSPERIIFLCSSCHKKIHYIFKEHQKREKEILKYLISTNQISDFGKFI